MDHVHSAVSTNKNLENQLAPKETPRAKTNDQSYRRNKKLNDLIESPTAEITDKIQG